ncbi:conserved exported hypothetical protein [Candidatus Sulfopaludibacter sp. SbA3]|nr:conserved exported hypothetical protein [Candidatus Sulfopaludibacter sp. SbA3]
MRRFTASICGLTGEHVALILAVGLVLGTFPVYGCPTILCLMAAVYLRVNLPALQLVNQLTSPLQLALLLPLARAGSRIFGSPAAGVAPAAWQLGSALLRAVGAWFCICVPLGFVLYLTLMCVLRLRRDGTGMECPAR